MKNENILSILDTMRDQGATLGERSKVLTLLSNRETDAVAKPRKRRAKRTVQPTNGAEVNGAEVVAANKAQGFYEQWNK